jgi:hypothetical protein
VSAVQVQVKNGRGDLVPLAHLQPRRSGLEPVPGFTATWRGRACTVQAVLERTAVVYEEPDGERLLANQRDLLVDPDQVRWQEPAIARGGQFHHRYPRRLVEPAAAGGHELETPAVDKPAAQPRPPLEERRRPQPREDAIVTEDLLQRLPPELRALVEQATGRVRELEAELQRHLDAEHRIRKDIRRCLGASVSVSGRRAI